MSVEEPKPINCKCGDPLKNIPYRESVTHKGVTIFITSEIPFCLTCGPSNSDEYHKHITYKNKQSSILKRFVDNTDVLDVLTKTEEIKARKEMLLKDRRIMRYGKDPAFEIIAPIFVIADGSKYDTVTVCTYRHMQTVRNETEIRELDVLNVLSILPEEYELQLDGPNVGYYINTKFYNK